ncbi:Transposon Tf2-9 polyprotein [Colletotrichum orbiculare MAFF 240422]|uniref:Transposon Tf2-9 polyprotein n=1 Tax=Colletotrichum orbiculare (strain 104-T / ATCC 96160 / CBS 514.97 / LARS 414 / MAFF 240422) TaxID=1213857 RepID=A0A484FII3_COLOR|nr:Transposon Tf2-9 polyprotein [Colletotrichum orbiculare MAFF 240422]
MSTKKIQAVKDWPTPTNVKEIQAFLGFANFYRRFLKDYAKKTIPLTELTRKDTKFDWTNRQEEAFQDIKNQVVSEPVLTIPDPDKPFEVETDASDYAIGGQLGQRDAKGVLHPCAFYSRKLSGPELNYQIHDKELMAIIEAFQEWRPQLSGTKYEVQVYTDHKNLAHFTTSKNLNKRQIRWSEFLSEFNFRIIYRKGTENGRADALSRRPDYDVPVPEETQVILKTDTDGNLVPAQKLLLIARRPWESISLDFIVKLPKSQEPLTGVHYDSVLVIVERLTKYAYFIPYKESSTAEDLAYVFLRTIVSQHGLPQEIVSDRDKLFTSKFWKSLISQLGAKHRLSTAFHPQTDGQTERINQILEIYLRCYVNYQQDNWVTLLPTAQFAYNSAKSLLPSKTSQTTQGGRQLRLQDLKSLLSLLPKAGRKNITMSAKHQTPSTSSGSQGTPPKGKQPVKPLDQEMKDVEPSSDEEDDTAELQNLHDNPDQQRLLALQQEVNTLRTAANIIQTPVESREKLRLNSPQAFDGTPGYLKGFLTQVRAYHRFHNLSFKDEAEQVIHAASFLKGRALAWFEPHLTDFLTHDWNDLKLETQTIFAGYHGFESALISLFQEPDEQRQYERDLAALKQKGAATHYAAEFRRICARLDYTDDTKIFMFYQGLKEDVKDELVKQDRPSDFITYAELAIKIDNRLFERRREKGEQRRPQQPNSGRKTHG